MVVLIDNPLALAYGIMEDVFVSPNSFCKMQPAKLELESPLRRSSRAIHVPPLHVLPEIEPPKRRRSVRLAENDDTIDLRTVSYEHPWAACPLTYDIMKLPIADASAVLHLSQNAIKSWCRKLGINRWPSRTINSLEKLVRGGCIDQEFGLKCMYKEVFKAKARGRAARLYGNDRDLYVLQQKWQEHNKVEFFKRQRRSMYSSA